MINTFFFFFYVAVTNLQMFQVILLIVMFIGSAAVVTKDYTRRHKYRICTLIFFGADVDAGPVC